MPAPERMVQARLPAPVCRRRSRSTATKVSISGAPRAIRYAETNQPALPWVVYHCWMRASGQLEVGAWSVARPTTMQAIAASPVSGASRDAARITLPACR